MSTTGTGNTRPNGSSECPGSEQSKVARNDSRGQEKGAHSTKSRQTNQLLGPRIRMISARRSAEPPITKTTLSELDVQRIVFNPKLRHDVNFDRDLHFRPNLDGEKGVRKNKRAKAFWDLFRNDLPHFLADPGAFEAELTSHEWCLPATLRAIGEILATLVPPEDRSTVEDVLNVELLMQQFSKGAADLQKLATWLSNTLKLHCAPMRDDWVDTFEKQLSEGDRTSSVPLLVEGLRTLLGVLEAMKLDVANHQIRCLRPLLIQDTVEFEQTFFLKKMKLDKFNPVPAYDWFMSAGSLPDEETRKCQGKHWTFFLGFVNLLFPSDIDDELVPETFVFDEERIVRLRADILDVIHLEVCLRFFRSRQLELNSHTIPRSKTTGNLLHPLSSASLSSHNRSNSIHSRPSTPTEFEKKVKEKSSQAKDSGYFVKPPFAPPMWVPHGSNAAVEALSVPSSISPSPSMSRASSSTSLSSLPSVTPPQVNIHSDPSNTEEILAKSIYAILDEARNVERRWQDPKIVSAIALEILRSSGHSFEDAKAVETTLFRQLNDQSLSPFQQAESHVRSKLCAHIDTFVARFWPLTTTQLFEAATTPSTAAVSQLSSPPTPQSISPFSSFNELRRSSPSDSLPDLARQIAHIGILHWRVWSPLVYLYDPMSSDTQDEKPGSHSLEIGEAKRDTKERIPPKFTGECMMSSRKSQRDLEDESTAVDEAESSDDDSDSNASKTDTEGKGKAKDTSPKKVKRPSPERQDSFSDTTVRVED